MSIIDLLRSDGSIVVNKKLARAIGLDPAIMYSELISKKIYFENRGQLTEDGFFFNTVENMVEDTTLSKHRQLKAIKELIALGLIAHQNRGLPQRRFFKVHDNGKIESLLGLQQKSKYGQLEVNKVSSNNTNLNNTKKNKRYAISVNGVRVLSYYNQRYEETFYKPHPTVTPEQLARIENQLEMNMMHRGYDEEQVLEMVDAHFENLSPLNDGKVFSFVGTSELVNPMRRYE